MTMWGLGLDRASTLSKDRTTAGGDTHYMQRGLLASTEPSQRSATRKMKILVIYYLYKNFASRFNHNLNHFTL